jgi:hypothetical protein
MRNPPPAIHWLCPHVVAALVLEALATRYFERGELPTAVRALELATELPLGAPIRTRVRTRLTGLRARLN